jgi:hypothetical protein
MAAMALASPAAAHRADCCLGGPSAAEDRTEVVRARSLGLIATGIATALLNDSRRVIGRDSVVTTGRIGDVFPRSRPEFRASYLSAVKELKRLQARRP